MVIMMKPIMEINELLDIRTVFRVKQEAVKHQIDLEIEKMIFGYQESI